MQDFRKKYAYIQISSTEYLASFLIVLAFVLLGLEIGIKTLGIDFVIAIIKANRKKA